MGARQVRFERPEERVDDLDVVGVIAIERLFGLVGRLTHSARRLTLHLPARWPWAIGFTAALGRLRALPLLA